MAGARLERTRYPGIYRRGNRYAYDWTDRDGKRHRTSTRTLDEARSGKRRREEEALRGVGGPDARLTFAEYAREWVDAYQGKGRGFRERTRDDYRRDLERYAIPFLGDKPLVAVRRGDIAAFIAWLADDQAQSERHEVEVETRRKENAERETRGERPVPTLRAPGPLRDQTISRIVSVVSACFATAVLDDLRDANPVSRAVLPQRDAIALPTEQDGDSDTESKALTRAELAAFLGIVHSDWRVFFRLLAATGLRLSEALALDVRHLRLDGARPVVQVRRALGRDGRVDHRPKSRHGVRDVPLPAELVHDLRRHIAGLTEQPRAVEERYGRLAFPSLTGTPMQPSNLRRRVLNPAAEEAGAGWAGFHAFRHTFASLHIEAGTNIVRLSRLLGHHAPSFTLDVYGHLLDDGLGDPLDLDGELSTAGPSTVDFNGFSEGEPPTRSVAGSR